MVIQLSSIGGTVVCCVKNQCFAWEPAWESFRPITSIAWDGTMYVIYDRAYCSDPLDPLYGYGSVEMKTVCDALTASYGNKVSSASTVPLSGIGTSTEWFYDRMVSLTPCAPRDRQSWKRMIGGRSRTLRTGPRNKQTRRTLSHR